MNYINVTIPDKSYRIYISSGGMEETGNILSGKHQLAESNLLVGKNVVIVTNQAINDIYINGLTESLKKINIFPSVIIVKEGETAKSLQELGKICSTLVSLKADRQTTLIALGGGVIGDLTGFTAATYMRGISVVQIPTSLLAMVDSSVGGKTGVNLPEGKNLVGAFYQPKAVFIDTDVLSTLPENELRAGIAEVIKYGIIADKDLFDYLENNIDTILKLDKEALVHIITTSCRIKAEVVAQDEKESDYRAILNFGHTIGHATEALTGYKKYKHGEAVSIGMVYASLLSYEMGMCGVEDCKRIKQILKRTGLPVELPDLTTEDIMDCIMHDKKVVNEKITFILIKEIGEVEIVDDVNKDILRRVLNCKRR